MKKYKILFADLDDTLIQTRSGKTFAQGMWDMELKLDVLDKIKELAPDYVFIVTNQGGIGKFFTEEEFVTKLNYIEVAIKSYIKHPNLKEVQSMYCDSMDKQDPFRKPNPGMVNYFIKKLIRYNINIYDLVKDKQNIYVVVDEEGLALIKKIKTSYKVEIINRYGKAKWEYLLRKY